MQYTDEQLQLGADILNQLGGRTFTRMTGAKNFALVKGGLQFDLPKKAHYVKEGISRIIITLDISDTYTLRAYKKPRRSLDYQLVEESAGLFCDDLQTVFTRITGLDTVMPKVYQVIKRSE